MFGPATDHGGDALHADLTQRQVADPTPGESRRPVFERRSTIFGLALALHLAVLASIAWLERTNPPQDAGGADEIPVEVIPETPQRRQDVATTQDADARRGMAGETAEQQPPAAQASAPEEHPARPTGTIVERPAESSLPQEARKRGAKPDAPPEKPRQVEPETKQVARANPFGGLSPAPNAPEAERAPAFLAPQSFLDPARPRPAPDATNDNYRAKTLGQVAAAMLEPERPRPKALAIVGFTIDDAGALVSAWLARPSGNVDLDAEALDMVRRAAPFPPPPAKADRNFAAAIAFGGD